MTQTRPSGAAARGEGVRTAIANGETRLAGNGRLVIRASGTEPVIRVMAEGDDGEMVTDVVDTICESITKAVA